MTNLNDRMNYIEGRFTGYTTNSYESLADYNAKIVAVKGSRSQGSWSSGPLLS